MTFNPPGLRKALMTLVLSGVVSVLLSACGGTKVYGVNKTVIFKEDMYNITNVQKVSQVTEARLPDNSVLDLTGAERKRVESLLTQHGSMFVQMTFMFDAEKMPYRANRVSTWRDYSRMQKSFKDASKDIAKLMKDKKKTQVVLR